MTKTLNIQRVRFTDGPFAAPERLAERVTRKEFSSKRTTLPSSS